MKNWKLASITNGEAHSCYGSDGIDRGAKGAQWNFVSSCQTLFPDNTNENVKEYIQKHKGSLNTNLIKLYFLHFKNVFGADRVESLLGSNVPLIFQWEFSVVSSDRKIAVKTQRRIYNCAFLEIPTR